MTRRCSCDIPFCDGIECYLADPADYAEDEPTTSKLTLAELTKIHFAEVMALRDADSTSGDPFEKRARRVA